MSALHDAVRNGMDIKSFNKLLKKKSVSLNHQDGDTLQAPLHLACSEGHYELAKCLIKAGANPNLRDSSGWSPLHCSCKFGHVRISDLLLQCKNIDGSILTIERISPLYYFVRKSPIPEEEDIYLSILEKLAQINDLSQRNAHGECIIHSASMGGNAVALRFLLDKGVSPDLRTLSGETPMHYATQLGRLDIINMLLARGGDPNVRADSGKTPLDLAREFKIPDIIDKMENPQKVVLQASQEAEADSPPQKRMSRSKSEIFKKTLKRTGSTVGRRESHGESQLRKKMVPEEEQEKEKEKEAEKKKDKPVKKERGFARKLTSMVLSKEDVRQVSEYAVGMTIGEFADGDFLHRGIFHAWSQDYEDFALPVTFGVYATEIFVFENGVLTVVLPRDRVAVRSLRFRIADSANVFDVGCFEGTRSYFARLSTASPQVREEWCQLLHVAPGEEIPAPDRSHFLSNFLPETPIYFGEDTIRNANGLSLEDSKLSREVFVLIHPELSSSLPSAPKPSSTPSPDAVPLVGLSQTPKVSSPKVLVRDSEELQNTRFAFLFDEVERKPRFDSLSLLARLFGLSGDEQVTLWACCKKLTEFYGTGFLTLILEWVIDYKWERVEEGAEKWEEEEWEEEVREEVEEKEDKKSKGKKEKEKERKSKRLSKRKSKKFSKLELKVDLSGGEPRTPEKEEEKEKEPEKEAEKEAEKEVEKEAQKEPEKEAENTEDKEGEDKDGENQEGETKEGEGEESPAPKKKRRDPELCLLKLDFPLMLFFQNLASHPDCQTFLQDALAPFITHLSNVEEGLNQWDGQLERRLESMIPVADQIFHRLFNHLDEIPPALREMMKRAQDVFSPEMPRGCLYLFFGVMLGTVVMSPNMFGLVDHYLGPEQQRCARALALLFECVTESGLRGEELGAKARRKRAHFKMAFIESFGPQTATVLTNFRDKYQNEALEFCEWVVNEEQIKEAIKRTSVRFVVTPRVEKAAVETLFEYFEEVFSLGNIPLLLKAHQFHGEKTKPAPPINTPSRSPINRSPRLICTPSNTSSPRVDTLSSGVSTPTSRLRSFTLNLPGDSRGGDKPKGAERTTSEVNLLGKRPKSPTHALESHLSSSSISIPTNFSARFSGRDSGRDKDRSEKGSARGSARKRGSRPMSEMNVGSSSISPLVHSSRGEDDPASPSSLPRSGGQIRRIEKVESAGMKRLSGLVSECDSADTLSERGGKIKGAPKVDGVRSAQIPRHRSRTACSPPPMRKSTPSGLGLCAEDVGDAKMSASASGSPTVGEREGEKEYKFFYATKIKPLKDIWPSKPPPPLVWPKDTHGAWGWNGMTKEDLGENFVLEFGTAENIITSETEFEIEHVERITTRFFKDHLMTDKHSNYIAMDEALGPVVCSVEDPNRSEDKVKLVIRTKKGDERIFAVNPWGFRSSKLSSRSFSGAVPGKIMKKDNTVKIITNAVSDLENSKLYRIDDSNFDQKLVKFEQDNCILTSFKFGVLSVKKGQTDEDQWYSNSGSPDFFEFMDFLAQKIALKDWRNFRGGLDTKSNVTGTHSYYQEHRGFEVMFHVAPLLPYNEEDVQQLERKRHLGNDVVLIFFLEEGAEIDVSLINSQFNHVFCLVQKCTDADGNTQYRVMFAYKKEVLPFTPFLPKNWCIPKNAQGKEFLMTKLINGELAALLAPVFLMKSERTRNVLLTDMVDTAIKEKEAQKK